MFFLYVLAVRFRRLWHSKQWRYKSSSVSNVPLQQTQWIIHIYCSVFFHLKKTVAKALTFSHAELGDVLVLQIAAWFSEDLRTCPFAYDGMRTCFSQIRTMSSWLAGHLALGIHICSLSIADDSFGLWMETLGTWWTWWPFHSCLPILVQIDQITHCLLEIFWRQLRMASWISAVQISATCLPLIPDWSLSWTSCRNSWNQRAHFSLKKITSLWCCCRL